MSCIKNKPFSLPLFFIYNHLRWFEKLHFSWKSAEQYWNYSAWDCCTRAGCNIEQNCCEMKLIVCKTCLREPRVLLFFYCINVKLFSITFLIIFSALSFLCQIRTVSFYYVKTIDKLVEKRSNWPWILSVSLFGLCRAARYIVSCKDFFSQDNFK